MTYDTVSEWRRLFRKYRTQGYGFLWCLKISWYLERVERRRRAGSGMNFEQAMALCQKGVPVTREAWKPYKWAAYLIDDECKAANDWKVAGSDAT